MTSAAVLVSAIIFFRHSCAFHAHPIYRLQLWWRIGMSDLPGVPVGPRRDEDVALDLMKFVAMTTGYGKTSGPGAGFQGTGTPAKAEDYADHLLQLYTRCLETVRGKK
jgi:hypothetical protein